MTQQPEIRSSRAEPASAEQVLEAIERNRDRIRSLLGMVLSASGVILSASFVIVFFVVRDWPPGGDKLVAMLYFASVVALIASILVSVRAVRPRVPVAIRSKVQLISVVAASYQLERRQANWAAWFMIAALLAFLAGSLMLAAAVL